MTVFGESHMHMFKLNPPASVGTTWKTSFVIRKNDNVNMSGSVGFTVIHDDIDQTAMGYYLSAYARYTCDGC
jgi:hypothetical protein